MENDFTYYELRKGIITYQLENKQKHLYQLENLVGSITGRDDVNVVNKFIFEAVQLIKNSIRIFEEGYFDCAFYSLRQSIEISTTFVYLVDENNKKEEALKKWKKKEPLCNVQSNVKRVKRKRFRFF